MTVDDADKLLKMMEMRGPRLRDAGYTYVELEGLGKFQLAPADPPPDDTKSDEDFFGNPLDDPSTFGRKTGVPTLKAKDSERRQ